VGNPLYGFQVQLNANKQYKLKLSGKYHFLPAGCGRINGLNGEFWMQVKFALQYFHFDFDDARN